MTDAPGGYRGRVLDLHFVRSNFPAFSRPINQGQSLFENAGGSFACRHTIEALTEFYTDYKVQPYGGYEASARGGALMDRSRARWGAALGVEAREVVFGPSTSANTYVLAHAFADVLEPGHEVIVTNQDHESNTGAFRRAAERLGCTIREWRTDPVTGLLDIADLERLLSERTGLVTVPHASNIVGVENDVARITTLVHAAGARIVVDGVSFAPHTLPDVGALGADVYLFSLYKTYSVHQGLMVVRAGLMAELPNQGHFFNDAVPDKRLNPAGPDHAQVAAAGAVLDYIEELHRHHGGAADDDLRTAVGAVSALWRSHEDALTPTLTALLAERDDVRLLGPVGSQPGAHRCPTIAFSPLRREPADVAQGLVDRGVQTQAGHFYAARVLDGVGIDPDRGVVRLSMVHYTSREDVERAATALDEVLSAG
ncbi:MAG TPA: aminotransferase class V-fold PLP-dependent enzyme [Ilumatobacteraceae bacterium]|nr:aminotransferase class V-fold PLP-dependent enzyme [Ilumatobacteraceae bacterium]